MPRGKTFYNWVVVNWYLVSTLTDDLNRFLVFKLNSQKNPVIELSPFYNVEKTDTGGTKSFKSGGQIRKEETGLEPRTF